MNRAEQTDNSHESLAEPFRGLGYAVEDRGSSVALDEQLRAVADAGFTHAELDPSRWDLWLGGQVNSAALRRWSTILDRHRDRIGYTMHGPFEVNLFDLGDRGLHQRLLRAGLDVARAIGASVTVYHPGRRQRLPLGASVAMSELMALERQTLVEVANEVESWGGQLAVETWVSYGEADYSYAVWPDQLAQQVAEIGHPAVGVCLDFGHLFLSARWYGFDYIQGIARLAPLVNHFHLQDLFGTPLSGVGSPALGQGDLHLPPGWGAIPFDEVFTTVAFPRRPILMAELYGRFLPELDNVLVECKRLAKLAPNDAHDRDGSAAVARGGEHV